MSPVTGESLVALVILGFNYLLETNYLSMMAKPTQASNLDVLGPWPWNLLPLSGITPIAMVLCYLPFARKLPWRGRIGA